MRVKVRGEWFSSYDEPICIQISESEQQQIADIDRGVAPQGKYAVFPESDKLSREEMIELMDG